MNCITRFTDKKQSVKEINCELVKMHATEMVLCCFNRCKVFDAADFQTTCSTGQLVAAAIELLFYT